MQKKLMTLSEIALDRHITVEEAQHLVAQSHCPKIFKTAGTYYLI
ncbi:hypothetical protein [Methylobacterium iners]|uniref:Uncharacterized protein n=1 Tax=Methylobacterium iners TaxID=418707 RepID=A0ABQ4S4G2_9HYPH|nr:hypothetical protein [Methylobacterium iners]GJD97312.1 hypothetical protein OCOJLMKI_4541 [Methylobacterium iners]